MKFVIYAVAALIVFIAVMASLGTLNIMVAKYNECKEHMFSETPQCNMVAVGQTISSGTMIVGFLAVVSVGAAYIIIYAATREKKNYSPYGLRQA